MTHRRTFLKTLAAGGTVALTGIGISDLFRLRNAFGAPSLSGAVPVVHGFSVEAVLNSRLSYHSVGDDALPDEVLANVLWAAGKAPVVGSTRRIFVATFEGVFEYDAATHSVSLHKEGNHMSEPNIAFELVMAGDSALDAGAALQYAHLASTAFWTSGSDQVACCTKESAAQNARNSWDAGDEVQMANCYGRVSQVAGILTDLAANPSDDSLPAPTTDGDVSFEAGLDNLRLATEFANAPLSPETIGQILWASYGCTPHNATNGPAGLTVGSAAARYYLTDRVYLVTEDGVHRYHNRQSGDPTTRDHRLEPMSAEDVRAALCAAEPTLPQGAPAYLVFASWEASNWSEVEAGFAGANALLQASSMGLAGHLVAVSAADGVRNSLSLPDDDVPLLVMALGNVATTGTGGSGGTTDTGGSGGANSTTGGSIATGGTTATTGGSSGAGGTNSTMGGMSATGGASSATGGSDATGGTSSTAGGSNGAGGASPTTGGMSAAGGASSTTGGTSTTGGSNGDPVVNGGGSPGSAALHGESNDPGCSCQAVGGPRSAALAGLAMLLGFVFARRSGKRNVES